METDGRKDGGVADKVRERAAAQLSVQKERATEGLGSVAQAVRQTTEQLRNQQHDTVARYAERAADQIERFSQRLRDKDVGELLDDAQRLARRRPALFVGGAFALGLLGARFLKSSANNHRESLQSNDGSTAGNYDRGTTDGPSYGTRPSAASTRHAASATIGTAVAATGPAAAEPARSSSVATSLAETSTRSAGTGSTSATRRRSTSPRPATAGSPARNAAGDMETP